MFPIMLDFLTFFVLSKRFYRTFQFTVKNIITGFVNWRQIYGGAACSHRQSHLSSQQRKRLQMSTIPAVKWKTMLKHFHHLPQVVLTQMVLVELRIFSRNFEKNEDVTVRIYIIYSGARRKLFIKKLCQKSRDTIFNLSHVCYFVLDCTTYTWTVLTSYRESLYTVKKRFAIFPSPAGMSLIKLTLDGTNLILPAQEEFSQWHPGWGRETR